MGSIGLVLEESNQLRCALKIYVFYD
uniref:Uncharacterized protein n=1 Tax=Anopheles arabiensis TaxID=7173 RepID=A0A182IC89_ANOAR